MFQSIRFDFVVYFQFIVNCAYLGIVTVTDDNIDNATANADISCCTIATCYSIANTAQQTSKHQK